MRKIIEAPRIHKDKNLHSCAIFGEVVVFFYWFKLTSPDSWHVGWKAKVEEREYGDFITLKLTTTEKFDQDLREAVEILYDQAEALLNEKSNEKS